MLHRKTNQSLATNLLTRNNKNKNKEEMKEKYEKFTCILRLDSVNYARKGFKRD
jgi:hypothetical protein